MTYFEDSSHVKMIQKIVPLLIIIASFKPKGKLLFYLLEERLPNNQAKAPMTTIRASHAHIGIGELAEFAVASAATCVEVPLRSSVEVAETSSW